MPDLILSSFIGGLWLPEGKEFAVPSDALLVADNIEYLQSHGLTGRRGQLKFNSTALDGGDPIRALWRHYPRTGTKNTLAMVDVGASVTAYKADNASSTFSSATTGLPDDSLWGFANWPAKNKTFIVSGERDGTGTGGLRVFDGSTVAAVVAGGANQVTFTNFGPYITMHKSRLWSTKLSESNFSVYASNVTDETTWLSASQLTLNDPQGGSITGIVSYGDFLLLFKESSIHRFVGDISTAVGAQLALYNDEGCVAPQSIAVTPFGVIYVGRRGVFLTDGARPTSDILSTPINSLFIGRSTDTEYPNAIGRWYPDKQQYVLKLDPTASDGYILTRLVILVDHPLQLERSRPVWVWSHRTNLPMISGSVWDSETDDGRLLIGDSVGFIRTYDTGSTDDGTAIVSTAQTASVAIDNTPRDPQFRTGRAKRVKMLHRAANTIAAELLYDQALPGGGAAFVIGDTTLEEKFYRANVSDQTLWGRFVSLWFRNSSSSAEFEVHSVNLETRLLSERVWRDDNDGVSGVIADEGNVVISGTATEAVVTFAVAQTDTNYEIAFGLAPSTGLGPSTVGIKPGSKSTAGFTAEVGGAPGVGNSYTVSWILSRAA